MSDLINCPICSSTKTSIFFETTNVPVHIGLLWESKKEALDCPKGDIKLAFCGDCGLIWNLEFQEAIMEYAGPYDNSLHFSHIYQDYARSVADRLVKNYQLYGKKIIEIGSGRGDFLSMLCTIGNNQGIGFDPSFDGERLNDDRITLYKDFYSEKYKNIIGDLICSRYVLEHIPDPFKFMRLVRSTIGENGHTVLYFEVPNVSLILKKLSAWDIIYEHCFFFGLTSLERLFNLSEFNSLELYESFDGQFICIEALPTNGPGESKLKDSQYLEKLSFQVSSFSKSYIELVKKWENILGKIRQNQEKTIIWGAGAKGVSFLNMLNLKNEIQYAVDINPRKKGHFIPGTGQKIVLPKDLMQYKPDNVIIMNPIYKDEIQNHLKDLGLNPKLYFAL
jgi:hypothetical protein